MAKNIKNDISQYLSESNFYKTKKKKDKIQNIEDICDHDRSFTKPSVRSNRSSTRDKRMIGY